LTKCKYIKTKKPPYKLRSVNRKGPIFIFIFKLIPSLKKKKKSKMDHPYLASFNVEGGNWVLRKPNPYLYFF